ncbi:hypothetical protein H6F93_07070 [Leptolyngbya sp. FACHB-671]|uniref:hypothetical protein n=1 Tax=Leptolyngbya sp. FACHB-671 TaxID=2692812 RepID=UPI0016858ADF|nr:hypothetical protein [Leptolyngbya sp. FACHB-671]MBD2067289.1 hypothetical protein [Leptolyngbya sp. FACHB-671]
MAIDRLKLSDLQPQMGRSNLQGTVLRNSSLLVFDYPVAENGTVAFETLLTTKNFPLLISSHKAVVFAATVMQNTEDKPFFKSPC